MKIREFSQVVGRDYTHFTKKPNDRCQTFFNYASPVVEIFYMLCSCGKWSGEFSLYEPDLDACKVELRKAWERHGAVTEGIGG